MKKDVFPQGEDYSIPTDALPERASFFTAGDDGEIFVPKPAVNLPALKEKRVYVSCETGVHNMGSDFFEELLKAAFRVLDVPNHYRVDVELVSRATIKEYNGEKRGVDKVTDVLSFPSLDYEKPLVPKDKGAERFLLDEFSGLYQLGEILICRSVCVAQAHEYGHSVEREMGYLFVHGVLHLLGFDHMTDEEYRQMRDIEEKALAMVGLVR